ncbi:MAG TPA: NADH-quinone oxidoreductase subunit C [Trueperaceae bacterium]|nr:NADH-quinone oxidoreductase subunit C [Trueperaceae bacterium]
MSDLDAGASLKGVLDAMTDLGGVVSEFKGMTSVTIGKAHIIEALTAARGAGLELLSDIFGIDYLTYPGHRGKRFAVVYNVHDLHGAVRLFLRVEVEDGESLPTATGVWRGADFLERETFDMLGIEFEGHPNLRKLLTPEDLDGHPHRKDFPLGETPTLFNDGRFLDPATFRSGLTGRDQGLTGWKGGARDGVISSQGELPGEGRE